MVKITSVKAVETSMCIKALGQKDASLVVLAQDTCATLQILHGVIRCVQPVHELLCGWAGMFANRAGNGGDCSEVICLCHPNTILVVLPLQLKVLKR